MLAEDCIGARLALIYGIAKHHIWQHDEARKGEAVYAWTYGDSWSRFSPLTYGLRPIGPFVTGAQVARDTPWLWADIPERCHEGRPLTAAERSKERP